ncbi:MAG TPA: ferric reductase-like transmembrane domain-containing protein [Streptosporangiaceae bacterium]|jgi:sulfoxide reductase heme-binding subunit YedZ|nr:ferric reductase-like transmembrane domain-containing protein [Streptosporangiaceae bacterium]
MIAWQPLSAPITSGSTLLWYATRATGIVSLVLLTGTVMLGITGPARASSARWPRLVTAGLHRNVALTALALVGVHIITTVLDPYVSINLAAAFIPGTSAYRPLWLSLGAVAFDLMLAVIVTSLLRDRLSHRSWRAVHLLVYACWPIALWHGLGSGTDTRLTWVLAINIACVAAVGWAIWWRLSLSDSQLTRATGLAGLALVPVLTGVFVLSGPLQSGWARRAGTPVKLLGNQRQASSGSSGAAALRLTDAPFTGQLSVAKGPEANQRTISINGRTTAAPRVSFVIVLRGTPSGSGVSLTSGTVRIGRAKTASAYSGPVVQLAGNTLVASVSGQSGQRRAAFTLTINGTAVTGTVSLQAAATGG